MNDRKTQGGVWVWIFLAACVVMMLGEFAYEKHPHVRFEGWFAFFPTAGFLSSLTFFFVAQAIGYVIRRREDYYDH